MQPGRTSNSSIPSGFLIAVTQDASLVSVLVMFQSLSGFLIRRNDRPEKYRNAIARSQSLSGFLFAVTQVRAYNQTMRRQSFNPYRVFLFAVTLHVLSVEGKIERFNPYRVFIRCNRGSVLSGNRVIEFQSLSGFLIRCNEPKLNVYVNNSVSIPMGFLIRCNSPARQGLFQCLCFQSLSGFYSL